jgi:hypothetical protein
MSNTKHTAGPWAWQKFGRHYCLTAQHGMREIIIGSLAVEMPQETYPAMNSDGRLQPVSPEHPNATLIAAAPELLEALKMAKQTIDFMVESGQTNHGKTKEKIDNAIAKAEKQ